MKETHGASLLCVRGSLLVLGSWLLWVGFRIFPVAAARVTLLPLVVLVYLAALASLLGAATLRRRHEPPARAGILLATLAGVAVLFAVDVTVHYPTYRADTMVLAHIAAEHTLQGQNPYPLETAAVLPAIGRLGFPVSLLTQTIDGRPITHVVAYPALHFLVFVPALAVGIQDLRWVVLVFEGVALSMLWRWSPRLVQPLVFVPLLVNPDLLVVFTSGLTDWLWVTPLMVTALLLARGQAALAGTAYGCAAAMKPLPWMALPFLIIWLLKSRRAEAPWGPAIFLGTALATFTAINAPFILLDPGAWAHAVATPFVAPLVLDGHGLSTLSKLGLVPDSRLLYAALTAGASTIAAVVVYWTFFPRLQNTLWMFPAVVAWLSYRSFHNYIIYWIPPAFLWLVLRVPAGAHAPSLVMTSSGTRRPARRTLGLGWSAVLVATLFVSLTAGIGTVTSSTDPIGLKVVAVDSRTDPRIIDLIAVEVTNRTTEPLEPVFTVIRAGLSARWVVEEGPALLAAGSAALYRIAAPPGAGGPPVRNLYAGEAGPEREPVLLRVTATGSDAAASIWVPGF